MPDTPLPPLSAMFDRLRMREDIREQNFSKGSGYLLYRIVDANVDASFPMLRKMGNKLDRLEDDIFEGRSREIVRDLSNAKQEIINFRKIVRPQRAVLRDLERTKQRYLAEELEIYFDDISDAAERIWDTLENYKEVVEALESTNESVRQPPPERLVPDPDRGERHPPAADAHRQHLRHERPLPRRGQRAVVLRDPGADGHRAVRA